MSRTSKMIKKLAIFLSICASLNRRISQGEFLTIILTACAGQLDLASRIQEIFVISIKQ